MMKALIVVLATLILTAPATFYGQDKNLPTGPSDSGASLVRSYVEGVLRTIQERAPEQYKAGLRRISYKVVDADDPLLMRATILNNAPLFEISLGAFNLLLELAYAEAASVFLPEGPKKFNQWTVHVGKKLEEGIREYPDFLAFTGDAQPKNEYFPVVLQMKILTSLSYVVAHECSHILLDHTKDLNSRLSADQVRTMENAADKLTVDLLSAVAGNKSQAFVFYGTGYYGLFMLSAQMNRDVLAFAGMRDHPPEFERAARMAQELKKKAQAMVFDDPKGREFVERGLDQQIASYKMYLLVVEYQRYLYTPGTKDLSFDEWRKQYGR